MQNKKRIAIIFDGNSDDKKGAFNATHNRIKYLIELNEFIIDAYLIQKHENFLLRLLRKSKKREKSKVLKLENVFYQNLWINFSLLDYILKVKFHTIDFVEWQSTKKWIKLFQKYDFVSVHTVISGKLAIAINSIYKIPFAMTWHGVDIHTTPFMNQAFQKQIKQIIEKATINFFVSHHLMMTSDIIAKKGNKMVLFNGVNKNSFRKFSEIEKGLALTNYRIDSKKKNIAFIGNLIPIKNVECIPEIFFNIYNEISQAEFYIVGDGSLKSQIIHKVEELKIPVHFFGNKLPEEMPDIINCMDLIVLPSKNEGLPLIALEALACETMIVGSRVGGIPEVIGEKNTVKLDDSFNDNFAKLCIKKIYWNEVPVLSEYFDWKSIAQKEKDIYNTILK
jgi:teichuronic acid biosynthesis glycosyltransferase TuaC